MVLGWLVLMIYYLFGFPWNNWEGIFIQPLLVILYSLAGWFYATRVLNAWSLVGKHTTGWMYAYIILYLIIAAATQILYEWLAFPINVAVEFGSIIVIYIVFYGLFNGYVYMKPSSTSTVQAMVPTKPSELYGWSNMARFIGDAVITPLILIIGNAFAFFQYHPSLSPVGDLYTSFIKFGVIVIACLIYLFIMKWYGIREKKDCEKK